MNPRVLAWLRAVGLTPEDTYRKSGDDVPMVTIDGHRNIWTIHYSEWIMARWTEWAHGLGFKRTHGQDAHIMALFGGHTDAEFDAWLGVRGETQEGE